MLVASLNSSFHSFGGFSRMYVWSSVVMGVAAPLVGMRPGVIAGSAAVVAVPLGAFVAAHGPELVPVVVVEAAALQLAAGLRAGFTFT